MSNYIANFITTGSGGSGSRNNNCTVFVGNLSWRIAWQDLKDQFKQIGEVAHAEVMTENGSGRSKGCGTVEFRSPQDASEAVDRLNGSDLEGR